MVNSYVNEPLSADIAILDPKDLSESEVIASLATVTRLNRSRFMQFSDKALAQSVNTSISEGITARRVSCCAER